MAANAMDLKILAFNQEYPAVPGDTLVQWALEGRITLRDQVRAPGGTWQEVAQVLWLAPNCAQPAVATGMSDSGALESINLDDLAPDQPPAKFRSKAEDSEMDMTPMIDVTFQLLIFFMLTNSLASAAAVLVPEALHGKGVTPEGKQVLLIDDQGQFYLGEALNDTTRRESMDALIQEVTTNAAEFSSQNENAPLDVIITAHKSAKHGMVRDLVDRLGKVEHVGQVLLGVEEKR